MIAAIRLLLLAASNRRMKQMLKKAKKAKKGKKTLGMGHCAL